MSARIVVVLGLLGLAVAPQASFAKRGGTDRPLKGRGSQTTTFTVGTTPFPATAEASARLSHLGRSTSSTDYTILLTSPTTFTVAGTQAIVAANGDELFTSLTGAGETMGPFGVGQTSQTTVLHTITGGTGRFSDASGTFTATVSSEIVSLVGATATASQTFKLRGRISY